MILNSDLESWKVWLRDADSYVCVGADEIKYDEEIGAYLFNRNRKMVTIIPQDNILLIERMRQNGSGGVVTGDGLIL